MENLEVSKRVRLIRRAKALAVLSLPFLGFAVVVLLFSAYLRIHPAIDARTSEPTPISADDWLSAESASSSGASVEVTRSLQDVPDRGATTVTTYTVTGQF